MKDKLEQLYQYLLNNNYFTEAKTIKIILDEGLSNNTVSKIKEMCTPRYLGDLYIQEFDYNVPYKVDTARGRDCLKC
ncbi:MAG: hypothetical protein HFJ07_16665 [Lachnospiraceae bacterium]|nr:hypothetical protein [Lachnospiraceae bacterium]